jgi:hypothetical protein
MQDIYNSPLGLSVTKGDWEGAEWTITGYPNKKHTIREFDSAYDFEELVQEHISTPGYTVSYDSESCQFFAYTKTKSQAMKFITAIEKHFEKVRQLVGN